MMTKLLTRLGLVLGLALPCAAQVETTYQLVVGNGEAATCLASGISFENVQAFSLAADGRVAFTANIFGSGISTTNNLGLWLGLPGGLNLGMLTGEAVPATNGGGFVTYIIDPNALDDDAAAFDETDSTGDSNADVSAIEGNMQGVSQVEPCAPPTDLNEPWLWLVPRYNGKFLTTASTVTSSCRGQARQWEACRVQVDGLGLGTANNAFIFSGPPGILDVLAQTGSPAPDSTGVFTFITDDDAGIVLSPDGNVAFEAAAGGQSGIWFGTAGTLQAAALTGSAAPDSLLGSGYTWGSIGPSVEVNGGDQLAFSAFLNGPSFGATNSEFVIAGTADAPRVVAQSGQPAPGIPGAFFQPPQGYSSTFGQSDYEHELIGPDGAVAFVATYSTNANDYGLWLAPSNGATPILIMRTGQQAPGTAQGVVFTNFFTGLPPFGNVFMNRRDELIFDSTLTGPGVGSTNNVGIWQAEPDGTVNLVAISGQMVDTGTGTPQQLQISYLGCFGESAPLFGGPEDGRARLFNDDGQILFEANGNLYLAKTGLNLSAEINGTDLLVQFPTVLDKTYRLDYKTNLSDTTWSVAVSSVTGTGGEVTITNTISGSTPALYYRAVRTN